LRGTTLCALPYKGTRQPNRPSAHQVCGDSPLLASRASHQPPTSTLRAAGSRSSEAASLITISS